MPRKHKPDNQISMFEEEDHGKRNLEDASTSVRSVGQQLANIIVAYVSDTQITEEVVWVPLPPSAYYHEVPEPGDPAPEFLRSKEFSGRVALDILFSSGRPAAREGTQVSIEFGFSGQTVFVLEPVHRRVLFTFNTFQSALLHLDWEDEPYAGGNIVTAAG